MSFIILKTMYYPGQRLVPWNIFFSASAYERPEEFSSRSLEDLSILIDLLSLYDELYVIGDERCRPFLTHDTDFFDAMRESGAIRVISLNPSEEGRFERLSLNFANVFGGAVTELQRDLESAIKRNTVPGHFRLHAGMNRDIRMLDAVGGPFTANDLMTDFGRLYHDYYSPPTRQFFVRTFLYLAVSADRQIALTPDSMRASIATLAVATSEASNSFRDDLKEQFHFDYAEFPTVGGSVLRRTVSPFAATVLDRCKYNRNNIPKEILNLRAEMAETRKNIADLEHVALFGKGADARKAEIKWRLALRDLSKQLGPSRELIVDTIVTDKSLEPFGDLAEGKWPKTAVGVAANLVEPLKQYFVRKPIVQIHHIAKEVPAEYRLQNIVHQLFPELR